MCQCNAHNAAAAARAATTSSSAPAAHDDFTSARLPVHVTPSRYDLTIMPNLEDWTFAGYVCIHVDVAEETSHIQLHSIDLAFTDVTLSAGHLPSSAFPASSAARAALPPASTFAISATDIDRTAERARFTLAAPLAPGAYTLEIRYTGPIGDNLAGLYRSSNVDAAGVVRRIACTQFEATDARRCLPCWDEPSFKAVYGCTVVEDPKYTVLSNMPVTSQSTVADAAATAATEGLFGLSPAAAAAAPAEWIVRHFADSPLMSSYLLAFVVGEFDFLEKTTEAGVALRVYTPPGKASQGAFSLDLAGKALDFFARFFDEPFPLPKVDLIAIPDFAAGAMENWGLITYRDTALLVEPETTTSARLRQTARTVCHEVAHMWFGNLVTMEWWTHLWLNEGFARYCEFMAVNHAFPDWHVWQWFVADPYDLALTQDATKSSHAIEVEVNRPEEINSIFDAISYAKGASVIRQLAAYMGPVFAEGVRIYLKRYKYKNALSRDLWACLDEAWAASGGKGSSFATEFVAWEGAGTHARPSIEAIMEGWTRQVNYPIITVTRLAASATEATFRLEQSSVVTVTTGETDDRLWSVMLQVSAPLSADPAARHSVLFNGRRCEWTYHVSPNSPNPAAEIAALKFNADCTGVARIHYTDGVTSELKELIRTEKLSPEDKLGLLRDTVALYRAGVVPIGDAIDLFLLFADEDNLPVLTALSSCICTLLSRHASHSAAPALRARVRTAFAAQLARFGWGDTDPATGAPSDSVQRSKRVAVIAIYVACMDPVACTEGMQLYNTFLAANKAAAAGEGEIDLSMIAPDLQGTVLALGASNAGRTTIDYESPEKSDFDCAIPAEAAAAAGLETFETMKALHAAAKGSTSAQLKVVSGMAAIRDAEVRVERVLPWMMDGTTVRMQDKPSAVTLFAQGKGGDKQLWTYLKENWATVYPRFKTGYVVGLRPVVVAGTIHGTTQEELDDVIAFFKENPCPEAQAGIDRVIDVVSENVAKLPKEREDLTAYAEKNL